MDALQAGKVKAEFAKDAALRAVMFGIGLQKLGLSLRSSEFRFVMPVHELGTDPSRELLAKVNVVRLDSRPQVVGKNPVI